MTKKQLKQIIKECINELQLHNESMMSFTDAQNKTLKSYKNSAYVVSGYDTGTGVIYLTDTSNNSTIGIDKNGKELTVR